MTTAKVGNITRASEWLHVSQPALSRALQDMEDQLGVALFHRTTRQLTLAAAGQRFLPQAQRLLRDMEEVAAQLLDQRQGLNGSVTLAVGSAFGCTVLPAIIKRFMETHPDVQIDILDDNSAGITSRVARVEVDLGVGSLVGDTSTLSSDLLLTAPLGLLGDPQRFDLAGAVARQDFSNLPILKEPDDSSILQLLRSRGSVLVANMRHGTAVSSLTLQLALAAEGAGVAVVSALGASHAQARGLQFVPLKPVVEREVFLIRRGDRDLAPAARLLANAIADGVAVAGLHPEVTVQPR